MPVNMVLRMVVGILKLAQTHLDTCILCTSTSTFRANLTTANIQLLHLIAHLENMAK